MPTSARRAALNSYLRANAVREYCLGEWDCAEFAFGAVHAQTGRDHIAEYRGLYQTHSQAVRLMKRLDRAATVRGLATRKLGRPVPLAQARTGDLVHYQGALGVVYGENALFLREDAGYCRLPVRSCEKAWAVK